MKAQSKKEFTDSLGKKIASVRKASGFTQMKLAEAAKLDRMTIALVETGKKKPSLETIYRLAVALNIESSELFVEL